MFEAGIINEDELEGLRFCHAVIVTPIDNSKKSFLAHVHFTSGGNFNENSKFIIEAITSEC
jgi:hypothetical protein